MHNINDICDYIIIRLRSDNGSDLNHLKLQKLLYYSQAWNLAFDGTKLFRGNFQAWIHGPVNRTIYDRFKDTKYMYSNISMKDVLNRNVGNDLAKEVKLHIDTILDTYAQYSPTQLENMTHNEEPWIQARDGYEPNERCEEIIDEDLMRDYYKKRLA